MNPNQIIEATKAKLATATEHFKQELKKLRTGRANPSMVENVIVEAYGQQMPLKAVGSIIVPEAQLLQVTPFDPNNLQPIAEAIRNDQALGLTPTDDGRVVRIQIPPLTTETREQMVKSVGQKVEDCMINVRQIRHEAFHNGEQAEKDKNISKDDRFHFEKQIDELLAKQKADVEALAKEKEQEIMTV